MIISLAEAKEYLRIDTDWEDALIEQLIKSSQKLCADVARLQEKVYEMKGDVAKIAVLYALAYMYENRADADYQKLTFTLRSLLFPIREETFSGGEALEVTSDTDLTFAVFDINGNIVDSGV